MQSRATTIDAYLSEVPADRRDAMSQIRAVCRQILKGYEEAMEYGMPAFRKDDTVVAFNNQKNYIALYIRPAVVTANRQLLKGLSVGKSCIRYTKPEMIDFAVVRKLLTDTLKTAGNKH